MIIIKIMIIAIESLIHYEITKKSFKEEWFEDFEKFD
jgi:hypothetical protein